MAIKVIERKWCAGVSDYRYEFIMDSDADAENLPKCCTGSIAMVADKGVPSYMVNASGEWKGI